MQRIYLNGLTVEELTDRIGKTTANYLLNMLQPQTEQEKYLTRNECAAILKLSLVTLNKYSKKGIIPSFRVGSAIRYKESDIKALIENGLRFNAKNGRV